MSKAIRNRHSEQEAQETTVDEEVSEETKTRTLSLRDFKNDAGVKNKNEIEEQVGKESKTYNNYLDLDS